MENVLTKKSYCQPNKKNKPNSKPNIKNVRTDHEQKTKTSISYTKSMSTVVAKIGIWSNNPLLKKVFLNPSSPHTLKYLEYKKSSGYPYVIIVIDLDQYLGDITQKVIEIYEDCRLQKQRLTVVLAHGQRLDSEKNIYFSQLLQQLAATNPIHRLVITKDLYHGHLLDSGVWLEKHILSSLVDKKTQVSSKGENLIYPLSYEDLLTGLQKTMFLSGTAGKEFWLIGDGLRDLDLAYLIQKSLDDSRDGFDIETTGANDMGSDLSTLGNQSRASLNWEPVVDFTLELKSAITRLAEDHSLLLSRLHQEEVSAKKRSIPVLQKTKQIILLLKKFLNSNKKEKKIVETSKELLKRTVETTLLVVTAIYFILSVCYLGFTFGSLLSLEKSMVLARNEKITDSVKQLKKSVLLTKVGESTYALISPIFSPLAPAFHEKNHNLFAFLHYTQSSLGNLQQTYLLSEKIYYSIGQENLTLDYADASLALGSNLSQIYENLIQIRLLTKGGRLPDILAKKLQENSEFQNISLLEQQIPQLIKSVELIPAFLAGDSYKNIVFLFQNSGEIRSTGGAVDYLLALVLDHGRVVSRHLYTSSEIDSLLAKSPLAPPLINLYTGSDKWQTRDLNYNPDFTVTAPNFATILEESLKFRPDVIVAVNDSLIAEILQEKQGDILNGQPITKEIFRNELKAASPSPLYLQLINHYLDQVVGHQLSLATLGRVIAKQSLENQILFWTADHSIEKVIVDQSYSGGVYPHTCHVAVASVVNCISETTYFNESNFSLVPVGSDLKKKIIHQISFSETDILHQYLVDYIFIGATSNLNRDLNEIVQIYTPANSTLEQIQVNGQDIPHNSVLSQVDNQLIRYQIPVHLRFNVDNHLQISFRTPLPQRLTLPFAYSLTEYRQPGILPGDGEVQLQINTPDLARATLITAPATSTPQGYQYLLPPQTSAFGLIFEPKSR